MTFKVFVTTNIGEEALNRLREQAYEIEVYDQIEPPPYSLIVEKVRSGVDALITTLRDRIDEDVFSAGQESLRVVGQYAVGFDNIDREAANRYRIPFTNTADVLTDTTAEFAFFILGAVARKLYPSERLVREKKWGTWHPSQPFLGDEVTGRTVSVIGTGRIGQAFIQKCVGFRMDIRCFDSYPDEEFAQSIQEVLSTIHRAGLSEREQTIRYAPLDEVLREGDFVSLHVPLTRETRYLIDAEALEQMKSTAYLINTSRGPVIDEQALYQALKQRTIAGAALDVFEKEPLPDDSPLRDPELADRLRMFHHFASAGRQTRLSADPDIGMAGRCVQGVIDVLEGRYDADPSRMPYVVNKEAFEE